MSDTWLSRLRKSFLFRVVLTPVGIVGIALQLSLYVVVPVGGVLCFVHCTLAPVQRVWEAKAWQETPCTITKSQVEEREPKEDSYVPRIKYRYSYGGSNYQGRRYSFGGRFSRTSEYCDQIVEKYPLRSQQVCYVNPEQPFESVLYRGYEWGEIVFGLLGIPITLFFLGHMVSSLFRKGLPSVDTQGPVQLRAQDSPLSSLATALTVFAFVAIFTATAYFEGDTVVAAIFGMPTGIAALAVVWILLSLLNPRLTVNVSRFPIPAGEEFEIEWRFRGSTKRLRRLKITLEGPKYSPRSSSRCHTIAETEDAAAFAQGKVLFSVPADTRDSDEHDRTKEVWHLSFHGAIPMWPEVFKRFEVRVASGTGKVKPGDEPGSNPV